MKINHIKKLMLLLCLYGFSATAQVTYTGLKKDYTQSMDSLMTRVNKQNVTTGILYDRIMTFANLTTIEALT